MGQRIEVTPSVVDDILVLDTDRSITGQDGTEYPSRESAESDDRFPGQLASRLFQNDGFVEHVFVASNAVVVKRSAGWEEDTVENAARVVSDFFLFYPEAG